VVGEYYIYSNGKYVISNNIFDNELTYYVEDKTTITITNPDTGETTTELLYPDGYRVVKLVNDANYVYVANKFY
jgi:hypothetical protein